MNWDDAPTASNGSTKAPEPSGLSAREAIFILVVALVGFGFLLEPGAMPWSKHSDVVAYHMPLKYAAYRSLEAGEGFPLWRRDMLSGGPALTNPQAVYLHPLQWPYLISHPTTATGVSYWLHFLCMGLSMWVLGAALGLSSFARVFVAVAGMFSFKGIAIAYAGWLPVMPGFVCAPLLIAGVLRAIDRPGLGALLLLASAGSLVLHSGHLQIPYYLMLFLGVYFLWCSIGRGRAGRTKELLSSGSVGLGAAAIALASAGVVLLPFFAELDWLARATADFDFLQSEGAYAPQKLATFLHPEILGTPLDDSYADTSLWEDVAYFGAIPQLLAVFAAFAAWRRRHVRFLVVAIVASIALTLDTFLLRALHEWVPGFSLFRHPGRFLFLTTLFGIALSGFGVDAALERFRTPQHADGARTPSRAPIVVAALLFALTLYEGATTARRYLTMLPAEQVVPPETGFADFFANDPGVYRVGPLQRSAINYAWAAFYDLEFVTGFEPHNYRHYQQYMNLVVSGRVVEPVPTIWMDLPGVSRFDLLEAMGVRYLVSLERLASPPRALALRATLPEQPVFAFYDGLGTATLFLYEVLGARERVEWAHEVVAVDGAAPAFAALAERSARRVTVVELPGARAARIPQAGEYDAIRLVSRGSSSLEIEAISRAGGLALISEVWHPGWRATVGGEPAEVLRANGAFLAVELPPGTQRLALTFEPPGLATGGWLTGAAALVLLLTCALWVRGWRARPTP